MTAKEMREQFRPGDVVTVTNHYITRPDHPCYGTRQRTVERVTTSHIHFSKSGRVQWPRAAQLQCEGSIVRLYGGGIGQQPSDLFLTIEMSSPSVQKSAQDSKT